MRNTEAHSRPEKNTHSVGYMKRNQIYSFEALHDVMAVYDREFGISKSHDYKWIQLPMRW